MAPEEDREPRSENADGARQPYEPPKLVVYGDISALTRSVGHRGNLDGGQKGTAKGTQP